MPKQRSTEAKLDRLRQLRADLPSPSALQELRNSLGDASSLVVAEAAALVGEGPYPDLTPDLLAAYQRFLEDPEKNDKQCRAKIAIVEALNKLEFDDEDFFLRHVDYVQLEPVWGGSTDTAVPVRVGCAFALVHIGYRDVLPLLVDMLADSDKAARVGAVQALTGTGSASAALLLRLKARLGDDEVEVISECFDGILQLTPAQGLDFVAEFVDSADDAIQQAALLALGNSRQPAAFELIKSVAVNHAGDLQEVAHLALALLRLAAATEFLLAQVAEQRATVATSALAALAVHRHDPRIRELTECAVTKNGDAAVRAAFDKRFGEER